jgi:hypothetical protein
VERFLYQVRNWRAHARALFFGAYVAVEGALASALGAAEGRCRLYGRLDARIVRSDGTILNLGCIARRVVTTAGVNYMRDDFAAGAGSADISSFKYHGIGTGTNAEAVGDTALQTEVETRVAGTQVAFASKQYQTVATLSITGARAITEHGIFSASSTGTLWDRSVFSALNLVNGDSIQFTYTLTISDGG